MKVQLKKPRESLWNFILQSVICNGNDYKMNQKAINITSYLATRNSMSSLDNFVDFLFFLNFPPFPLLDDILHVDLWMYVDLKWKSFTFKTPLLWTYIYLGLDTLHIYNFKIEPHWQWGGWWFNSLLKRELCKQFSVNCISC